MDLRRGRNSKSRASDVDEEEDDRDYFTVSHQSTKKKQSKAKKVYVKLHLTRDAEFHH